MMDWLAKALKLPQEFLSGGKGGGVIQVRICHYGYHTINYIILCCPNETFFIKISMILNLRGAVNTTFL